MLAIRLDPKIEKRLEKLAKKTGRTKTSYAREAIIEYLEDLEDMHMAETRAKKPQKYISAEEVKRAVGL